MRVLFVCGAYPREKENILKVNCKAGVGLQNAPNVFQWGVIKGFVDNETEIEVISLPFLPAFPIKYDHLYTPESEVLFKGKRIGRMLSYCDLIGYKTISMKQKLQRHVETLMQQYVDEKIVVLTYTPYVPFIQAIVDVKKKFPNIILASIVTDLVDDMMSFKSNRNLFKRIQCEIERIQTKKLYKYIDRFILLSEYMQEKIPESAGRNMVMEGIYAPSEEKHIIKKTSEIKTVLYTGTLEEFAGVMDLMKAFLSLNEDNYRLIVCGSGSCASFVKECARKDKRIIFKGLVDRTEVLRLQKEATLLINPRKPNGSITRYSFPSKTMEYLASGTPMLGYKLEGIPSDYYQYYYIVEDMSVEGLAKRMNEILSLPSVELLKKATLARSFILKNKIAKKQIEKVLLFLQ